MTLPPHLVTIELRNVGPRDVAAKDFDRDQPLQVQFHGAFYGVTRASGTVVRAPAVGARPPKSSVHLGPGLLKRGGAWIFTAVVSGGEAPTLTSPLVDTDLFETSALEVQTVKVTMAGIGVDVPIRRRSRRRLGA